MLSLLRQDYTDQYQMDTGEHIYTKTHNRYRIYKKDIAQEEAQNI